MLTLLLLGSLALAGHADAADLGNDIFHPIITLCSITFCPTNDEPCLFLNYFFIPSQANSLLGPNYSQ
jgi:hypothetical protein